MLRDVAIARIHRGLGFRSDQTDNIIQALQEAQRLLERGRTLPYFLRQFASLTTVAMSDAGVTLPTRFLREDPIYPPVLYLGAVNKGYPTKFTNFKDVDLLGLLGTFGTPIAYVLDKGEIGLYPAPDNTYQLFFAYFQGAEPLTTNIENAWLEEEFGAPEVLIGKAGAAIAADLGNAKAEDRFNKMYLEAWAGMFADTIEREEENLHEAVGERN